MKSPSTMLSRKQKRAITAGAFVLSAALAIFVIDEELNNLRRGYTHQSMRRALSLDLGGGNCEWKEPVRVVSDDVDFYKTLLVGFPSGDKRMAYVQMEALTGLPSKDDWDFVYNGYTNAPFIKTNYPHPSGIWSWGTEADEVALVVQYIRRSMVEYGDIMWYLSYESQYNNLVTICQRTGSEEYPWDEIEVSINALQTSLNHGDFIGKCEDAAQYLSQELEHDRDPHDKVTICHRTGCKNNPWVELEVYASSLEPHLNTNQGDFVGSCSQNPDFLTRKLEYNYGRAKLEEMYGQRSDVEDFYTWRDRHVIQEIYKYGWYIDYWMENGLLRDPFTHEETCKDEWDLYSCPKQIDDRDTATVCHRTGSPKNPWIELEVSVDRLQSHLDNGDFIGCCKDAPHDTTFVSHPPTSVLNENCVRQDPNCDKISGTCRPKQIISSDRLRDYNRGPAETEIIGNMLTKSPTMAKYVINKETWPCIWDKVIGENEGPMTFDDRNIADDPNFSQFMLEEMINEVTRLKNKYSSALWSVDANANRLVSLLNEHLPLLRTELDEVISGVRTLTQKDIYGPGERQAITGTITG